MGSLISRTSDRKFHRGLEVRSLINELQVGNMVKELPPPLSGLHTNAILSTGGLMYPIKGSHFGGHHQRAFGMETGWALSFERRGGFLGET